MRGASEMQVSGMQVKVMLRGWSAMVVTVVRV